MLGFTDYIQQAFSTSTGWNRDNSYGALNATARGKFSQPLLDFPTPTGLSLSLSSLSSPNLATSYSLNTLGLLDGSLSYLYTSLPLKIPHHSSSIPLRHLITGYRQLQNLSSAPPLTLPLHYNDQQRALSPKPTLLYGRLYLPTSHLEALYLRRLSPITQLKISCVSSSQLRSGGSLLFLLSQDRGKYSTEYLYSTDSALFGVRGLYNFGSDPRAEPQQKDGTTLLVAQATSASGSSASAVIVDAPASPNKAAATITNTPPASSEPRYGRFSAGAELYYGLLNASGGLSCGFRFATLPAHDGFPYAMTLTLNPLMGGLDTSYAVQASRHLALCSKFEFNVYSYESGFQVGMELWQRRLREKDGVEWARRKLRESGRGGWGEPKLRTEEYGGGNEGGLGVEEGGLGEGREDTVGVLKARMNQDGEVGLLWEGRLKELLYSFGVHVDFKQRERIFRGVGLEIQYSS